MELNAEQIKKALECCTDTKYHCEDCPYFYKSEGIKSSMEILMTDALSLIKELTEENERLRVVADMSDTTLTDALRIVNEFCDARIKRAKANTVRKMQERLKASLKTDYINGTREHALSVIDQIAKELLEEK